MNKGRRTVPAEKEDTMKFVTGIALAIILLLAGFAAGFPLGKSDGFDRGCEWALVQADIVARESGVFMPVYIENGTFKVVIRQPRDLYKRAWKLAEQHDEKQKNSRGNKVSELAPAGTVAYLTR